MCKGGSVVLRVSADVVGSVHVSASSIAGDSWRVARKGRSVGCLVAVGEVEEAVAEGRVRLGWARLFRDFSHLSLSFGSRS